MTTPKKRAPRTYYSPGNRKDPEDTARRCRKAYTNFQSGYTLARSCKLAGISSFTLYRWRKENGLLD